MKAYNKIRLEISNCLKYAFLVEFADMSQTNRLKVFIDKWEKYYENEYEIVETGNLDKHNYFNESETLYKNETVAIGRMLNEIVKTLKS